MCSPQKVVIPKGLVNPTETTIVEIPENLKNVPTVVARPRPTRADVSRRMPPPVSHKINKWIRRSMIQPADHSGYDFNKADPWNFTPRQPNRSYEIPTPPPMPPFEYSGYQFGEMSSQDISYDSEEGFDPMVEMCSTLQDIDDKEGSLYRDFRPKRQSSRPCSPARSPGFSMRSFRSTDSTPGSSYYKHSTSSCSPCGTSEETNEESSYGDMHNRGALFASGASGESSGSYCPPGTPSSYDYSIPSSAGGLESSSYNYYSSGGSSKPYAYYPSSSSGGGSGASGSPAQRDVMSSLGDLESVELQQIMGDLSSFQKARRQLVLDSSSLASASDVAASFLKDH